MKALVTGAAGFIGSSLVDQLLVDGYEVLGVDNFSSYYSSDLKKLNIADAMNSKRFTFLEKDLASCDIDQLLRGVTHVFHQAGQPGVRSSWGVEFESYIRSNVWATSRLLEGCLRSSTLTSFVAASSSSVYGRSETHPTSEETVPQPISPYGVTKLAAEHLCSLYGTEFGLPTISLRYFTVYGPRQRPDMAISRMIHSSIAEQPFVINGDGRQVRSFTYIDDVVRANISAAYYVSTARNPVRVFNVGSQQSVSLLELISLVESKTKKRIHLDFQDVLNGDPFGTHANSASIRNMIGWESMTRLEVGIERQVSYTINHRSSFRS